jgi:hypothetical protein
MREHEYGRTSMGPETASLATIVPEIDGHVLLERLLRPMVDEEGALTDALTGAVPTWRLDEEPLYLETVRDKGIPGTCTAPQGDVIKGVVVKLSADDSAFQAAVAELPDPSEEKVLTPKRPPRKKGTTK